MIDNVVVVIIISKSFFEIAFWGKTQLAQDSFFGRPGVGAIADTMGGFVIEFEITSFRGGGGGGGRRHRPKLYGLLSWLV